MNRLLKAKYWLLLLLLPLCAACNDADDLTEIFTGKRWRLTYINDGKSYGWYHFPNVTAKDIESYDPVIGSRSFIVEFSGAVTDDIISGKYAGKGSVNTDGNWKANGKSNQFQAEERNRSVIVASDPLGSVIADGLIHARSYSGDNKSLYLQYTYRNPATGETENLQTI